MKGQIPPIPGMPKNLGKYEMNDQSTLVDGINLTKPEFEKVAKVFHKMANKYGQHYSVKAELEAMFKSEMRQKFDVNVKFDKVAMRNPNETSSIELLACRFKKDRPLIFLLMDVEENAWAVIDEKRFPPLDEKSPFLPVNI